MNPHPNKKDVFDPEQARAMRKLQRIPKLDEEDEEEIDG